MLSGMAAAGLFAAMLLSPEAVSEGAQKGLLLWFRNILPTLFPFMIATGLMLSCGGMYLISGLCGRLFSFLFSTSGNGAFAVLTGFLCGYPMGAKTTADLVRSGRISRDEGAYLLSFCNNTSPAFAVNYIVLQTFGDKNLLVPTLLILFGVPVLLSVFYRPVYLKGRRKFPELGEKCTDASKKFDFSMLDSCLADSFDSIVKVGLYIIFFSVLIHLIGSTGDNRVLTGILLPVLEMTNGIRMIRLTFPDVALSYPLFLALSASGGLCAAAQTECMLRGSGLPVRPYIAQKLAAAAAASLLGIMYVNHF